MPLNRTTVVAGALLGLLAGCGPEDTKFHTSPASGQALAVAFGVAQRASIIAEAVGGAAPVGCRPARSCPTKARTVTTTLRISRRSAGSEGRQLEARRWRLDGSGSSELAVERTTGAPQGGSVTHTLRLLRVASLRYGAMDGEFVVASQAPQIDERLEADPQAEFDALVNAASQASQESARCNGIAAPLPGRTVEASVAVGTDTRSIRLSSTLDDGSTLAVDATETVACGAEAVQPPAAARAPTTADPGTAVRAFTAAGLREGWLLPPALPSPAGR